MNHACGVFGVYAPGQPIANLTYFGLYALQHRGQESAGIAVSDGEFITVVKDMGLVAQVFDERRLAPLDGHLAIGHVRYSTTGSSSWRNAQPVYRSVGDAGFALGHNGNLTNTAELAEQLGMLPGMLAGESPARLHHRLRARRGAHRAGVRDRAALRRPRPRARARTCAPAARWWVLVRDDGRSPSHRCARPARHLAAGAGSSRRRRVGARERDRRARHRGRALRARGRAGRDGRDRRVGPAGVPVRAARPEAVPVRVRVLRASRHDVVRPQRARGAPAHGRRARAPVARRRRHGHAGAGVGRPRGAGLCRVRRASPTATAW